MLVIRNGGRAGILVERNVPYRGCAKASRGSANMALSMASSAPQRSGQLWQVVQVFKEQKNQQAESLSCLNRELVSVLLP